eukprot:3830505-Pleurochrysis_carterae.AAC.2
MSILYAKNLYRSTRTPALRLQQRSGEQQRATPKRRSFESRSGSWRQLQNAAAQQQSVLAARVCELEAEVKDVTSRLDHHIAIRNAAEANKDEALEDLHQKHLAAKAQGGAFGKAPKAHSPEELEALTDSSKRSARCRDIEYAERFISQRK